MRKKSQVVEKLQLSSDQFLIDNQEVQVILKLSYF